MYDDLVKRLRNRRICIQQSGSLDDFPLLAEAADAIEELSQAVDAIPHVCECCIGCEVESGGCDNAFVLSQKRARKYLSKPRWIPVTERLPEQHVFVLIRQDDDRMMVAERVDGDWWYRYFAYDVDRWDEDEQGTITHWMPLPEPPKEE